MARLSQTRPKTSEEVENSSVKEDVKKQTPKSSGGGKKSSTKDDGVASSLTTTKDVVTKDESKETKKDSSKKRKAADVTEDTVTEDIVTETVSTETDGDKSVAPTYTKKMADQVNSMREIIVSQTKLQSELMNKYKGVLKTLDRVVKEEDKRIAKKQKRSASAKPGGFTIPSLMSKELTDFLKVPSDSLMSRTQVSKAVHSYIVEHKLQDPNLRRTVFPDATLKKLLNVQEESFDYLQLQKYLKNHYIKSTPPATSTLSK